MIINKWVRYGVVINKSNGVEVIDNSNNKEMKLMINKNRSKLINLIILDMVNRIDRVVIMINW